MLRTPSSNLTLIRQLEETAQPEKVIQAYKKFINQHPKHEIAVKCYGTYLRKNGNVKEGISQIIKSIELCLNKRDVDKESISRCALPTLIWLKREAREDESISFEYNTYIKQILLALSANPQVSFELIAGFVSHIGKFLGEYHQVIELCQLLLNDSPIKEENSDHLNKTLIALAIAHEEIDEYDLAESYYQELTERFPDDWRCYQDYAGFLQLIDERFEESIPLLKKAIKNLDGEKNFDSYFCSSNTPHHIVKAKMYYSLSIAYHRTNQHDEARECERRLKELDPDHAGSHSSRAKAVKVKKNNTSRRVQVFTLYEKARKEDQDRFEGNHLFSSEAESKLKVIGAEYLTDDRDNFTSPYPPSLNKEETATKKKRKKHVKKEPIVTNAYEIDCPKSADDVRKEAKLALEEKRRQEQLEKEKLQQEEKNMQEQLLRERKQKRREKQKEKRALRRTQERVQSTTDDEILDNEAHEPEISTSCQVSLYPGSFWNQMGGLWQQAKECFTDCYHSQFDTEQSALRKKQL